MGSTDANPGLEAKKGIKSRRAILINKKSNVMYV